MIQIQKHLPNPQLYPVVASEEYLSTVNGVVQKGYFTEGEKILPFVLRKRACFKWIQLDCIPYGCKTPEEEQQFLDNVVKYIRANMAVCYITTTNTAIFNTHPTDAYYCKFGTYEVDLTLTEDELFANLHSKHRNVVKKAQTLGLIVEHGYQCAEAAIEIMMETFGRQNKISGISYGLIEKMKPLGEYADYWIVKTPEGEVQGSAIFYWSPGQTCYYMHGGSAAHTSAGAMNLLMWEAMKEMKARGVRIFDFVGARVTTESGSKLEGIQRFKSRFGATMRVGYLFRVVTKKFEYFVYDSLIKLYFLLKEHKIPVDGITEERKKGNM